MRQETLLACIITVPVYLSRNEESWQLPRRFKVQVSLIVYVCLCVWGGVDLLKITAHIKNS